MCPQVREIYLAGKKLCLHVYLKQKKDFAYFYLCV